MPFAAQLIKTRPFHSSANFAELIASFAAERLGLPAAAALPRVRVLDEEIPLGQASCLPPPRPHLHPHASAAERAVPSAGQLPRLYRAADAFVLPSRGEGWGRAPGRLLQPLSTYP